MPFMSRYRLSNSSPFGFALVVSTGISWPSTLLGSSSTTGEMIFGYFLESHRKRAGNLSMSDRVPGDFDLPGTPISAFYWQRLLTLLWLCMAVLWSGTRYRMRLG